MAEWLDLIGSIIQQAALDYRLAIKKGYIVDREFVMWKTDAWMGNPDTVTTTLTFWHKGGLEQLCENLPIHPDYIRRKYEISK